ncbi:MAG: HD domain-containing protein, partial [Thermomicrobiaceae bacterium]|nr:HD domain-containing protein [Thermomicrobiaceae bacterium]
MTTEWDGILDVLAAAGELKHVRRQGWIDRGVVDPESVADHSYRMALLAALLALSRPGLDPARARALI